MGCGQSTPAKSGDNSKEQKAGGGASSDVHQEKKQKKQENKEFQDKMAFLEKVNLLKQLPADMLPLLAPVMIAREFKQGQEVIKENTPGAEFFVIRSGSAQVTKDGKEVANLKGGDYFGEGALIRDEPRSATVVANAKLLVYTISREKFQGLGLHEKLQFATRKAVGAGKPGNDYVKKEPTPKTQADKELLRSAMMQNQALSSVVELEQERINALIEVAWKEEVESGKEVVTEGDAEADYFYIIASGKFEVTTSSSDDNKAGDVDRDQPGGVVANLEAGGSFGELALLYLTPRAATVKATAASVLWVIDRGTFKNVLMHVSENKLAQYTTLLNTVPQFSSMLESERVQVAKAMVEMHFNKDEVILEQGENGSTFYLLYEGTVAIVKDGAEVTKVVAKQGQPKFFGEKALINEEKRDATVKVESATAKALALDKRTFDVVLQPIQDVMKAKQQGSGQADRTKIFRKDLHRIGLLGCGGFGTVELWDHPSTGMTFAMKALSKGYIVKTGMQESVMNEKNILNMTNSDFIIKLYETFNGTQSLYFLMEAALGGELYATYNRKGLHGSEKHAKFYIAGTVFAFEHCHERHIIYRDLKPENLLLTDNGQVKLTDMGLAKFVIGKTFTTCGTPDYFAPEIIASTGHTDAVDWWTLGILLFELMSGRPPFESAYPMQTYSKVMKGINKITFPVRCTGVVEPLIKGLLRREPTERLPVRARGTANIKEAKWYTAGPKPFDWNTMKTLKAEVPYKPVVKTKKDIGNFSARKEDMPKQIPYTDSGTGWDADFASSS